MNRGKAKRRAIQARKKLEKQNKPKVEKASPAPIRFTTVYARYIGPYSRAWMESWGNTTIKIKPKHYPIKCSVELINIEEEEAGLT